MFGSKMFSLKHAKNRFLLLQSYLLRKATTKGFPVALEIEVTNRCNLHCLTCPREKMKRPLGDMSFSLFRDIIDQAKEYVESVLLFHLGEPLLNPELAHMVSYCKKCGLKTIIFTNATLLDEKKSRELIGAELDMLVFSFDGADKETFEAIRRGAPYDRVLTNIRNFLKIKTQLKSDVFTQVNFVNSRFTKREIAEFLRMWKEMPVNGVRIKPFYNTANIAETIGEKVVFKKASSAPCIMLWREPVIGWDGTMFPCCVDLIGQKELGNVNFGRLIDVWNGKEMVDLRLKHIQGNVKEEKLCRTCNVFEINPFFLPATVLFDDLTVRKINPLFERLSALRGIKGFSYVNR